jgi:hypothetical protein
MKTDSTRLNVGKAIKYNSAFCAAGMQRKREHLIQF